MRDEYLSKAREVITDPYILVNVVSRRVKQLRRGSRPLIESLEKLSAEDVALREIAEGKISYEEAVPEVRPEPAAILRSAQPLVRPSPPPAKNRDLLPAGA
jgi:DNA-directed RNA polymerase subunit omega